MLELIDPPKDADGLHPTNLGRLVTHACRGRSPDAVAVHTRAACIEILQRHGVDLNGAEVCVVHALLELLHLWRNGELPGDLVAVVSNHTRLAHAVTAYGVPYHHVPVERGKKEEAERTILDILEGYRPDLLVLARYMQILSPEFVRRFPNRIINIHHSFLPAFVGKNPYEQAFARGVKLIGATAHYVTEGLDEGPIIEQDVARVTHRASLATLKQIGRDIERTVLARAVKWHLEDRILVHENKTIVFV
ncbi:MAG: formyltetrahydrofolate deformylase [Brockia lithotrophica]|nr:formyltetrahydrofolate deformylase [Brockia lithotrophica]